MNLADLSGELTSFLTAFYDAQKPHFDWARMARLLGSDDARVQILCHCLSRYEEQQTLYLPRVRSTDVVWYILVPNEEREAMRDMLYAFVGPTYCNYDRVAHQLDLSDAPESLIHVFAAAKSTVFTLSLGRNNTASSNAGGVRDALLRMAIMRDAKPDLDERVRLRFQQENAEFSKCLEQGLLDEAHQALARIRQNGWLSPNNLIYLELRLLYADESWARMLDDEHWGMIRGEYLPKNITQILLEAVYNEFLRPFEDDVLLMCEVFQRRVFHKFTELFEDHQSISRKEAHIPLLMASLLYEPSRPHVKDAILASYEDGEVLEMLSGVVETLDHSPEPPSEPQTLVEKMQAAKESGDYQSLFELAGELDVSQQRVLARVESAAKLQTSEVIQTALSEYAALDEATRVALDGRVSFAKQLQLLRDVSGSASEPMPESWLVWLQRLVEDGPWKGCEEQAKLGEREWLPLYEELNDAPDQLDDFLETLRQVDDERVISILGRLLPEIKTSLGLPDKSVAAFQEVYLALFENQLYEENRSHAVLESLLSLAEIVLQNSAKANQYEEVLEGLKNVCEEESSPDRLEWYLRCVEVFIHYPSPTPSLRQSVCSSLLNELLQKPLLRRNLEDEQVELLRLFDQDLQLALAFDSYNAGDSAREDDSSFDFRQEVVGKKIAIYTLNESVGRYLSRQLESMGAAQARTYSEHVVTDSLIQGVRSADLFVFYWGAAKHAAYYGIKREANSSGTVLLQPRGTGVSSGLSAIKKHLADEHSAL